MDSVCIFLGIGNTSEISTPYLEEPLLAIPKESRVLDFVFKICLGRESLGSRFQFKFKP